LSGLRLRVASFDVDIFKTATEATGLTPDEVTRVWDVMKNSPFRLVMEYELAQKIQARCAELKTASDAGDFRKAQGVIEGLEIAQKILQRKDKTLISTQR